MAGKRYNQEVAAAGINAYDSPLPGRGLQEIVILLVSFGVAGLFAGLGLSALFAPTLADVPRTVSIFYGVFQTAGALFGLVWFMAAHGYVKKMHQGLTADPEPEPEPKPDYDQPFYNSPIRVVPVYGNAPQPALPSPDDGPWEPSSEDIREFVMGWRARGGHQQAKWNGFRLASGVTITPRRWQKLCRPLRDAGILNGVDERITGDLQLTPEQIVEQLGL